VVSTVTNSSPYVPEAAIDLLDEPEVDGYGTVTLGRWGGWLVQICPMIFNDRLVLTPAVYPLIYDYGWCFPKGGAVYLAALAWNPATDGEPAGYIKAIHPGQPRQAGQTCALGGGPSA
jgi:hypothetical protein